MNKRTRKGAPSKDLKKQEDEERGPFIFKGWLLGGQRPVCPEETSTAKSKAIKIFLWLDYSDYSENDNRQWSVVWTTLKIMIVVFVIFRQWMNFTCIVKHCNILKLYLLSILDQKKKYETSKLWGNHTQIFYLDNCVKGQEWGRCATSNLRNGCNFMAIVQNESGS